MKTPTPQHFVRALGAILAAVALASPGTAAGLTIEMTNTISVTATSAVLRARVVTNEESSAQGWIYWGLTNNGNNATWPNTNALGAVITGSVYTVSLSGLTAGTTYWATVYATNGATNAWATWQTNFSTLATYSPTSVLVTVYPDGRLRGPTNFFDANGVTNGLPGVTVSQIVHNVTDAGFLATTNAFVAGDLAGSQNVAQASAAASNYTAAVALGTTNAFVAGDLAGSQNVAQASAAASNYTAAVALGITNAFQSGDLAGSQNVAQASSAASNYTALVALGVTNAFQAGDLAGSQNVAQASQAASNYTAAVSLQTSNHVAIVADAGTNYTQGATNDLRIWVQAQGYGTGAGVDGTTASQIVHNVTDAGFLATTNAFVAGDLAGSQNVAQASQAASNYTDQVALGITNAFQAGDLAGSQNVAQASSAASNYTASVALGITNAFQAGDLAGSQNVAQASSAASNYTAVVALGITNAFQAGDLAGSQYVATVAAAMSNDLTGTVIPTSKVAVANWTPMAAQSTSCLDFVSWQTETGASQPEEGSTAGAGSLILGAGAANYSEETSATALGGSSAAGNKSVALGFGASAPAVSNVAIGYYSQIQVETVETIRLGAGTVSASRTAYFWDWPILEKVSGTIPVARLPAIVPTNLAVGVADPWHVASNVTAYSQSTVTVTRAMGEYIALSLTNNATLCIDRSTYPTNGCSFVQVSLYIGSYSLTFCTNSISTNAATGNPPGSSGIVLTNNAWNSVIFHNPYGSSNVPWGVRQ